MDFLALFYTPYKPFKESFLLKWFESEEEIPFFARQNGILPHCFWYVKKGTV